MESGHEMIYVQKDHKYEYAHRLAMEKKLGRKLRPGEQVHHLNGRPSDNRPGNLEVVTMAEHNRVDLAHHHGGRPEGS
jgi:hypothetical protein